LERAPGTPGPDVRFVGQVAAADLPRLRSGAALALVPSRVSENLSMAAAEALASGLPVAASRVGGLPELIPDDWLTAPGDPGQLAATISRIVADPGAGARALERARAVTAPERVAPALAAAYEHALARR
jgi:phosphatidyl-myo-inositol dimannoside synthase